MALDCFDDVKPKAKNPFLKRFSPKEPKGSPREEFNDLPSARREIIRLRKIMEEHGISQDVIKGTPNVIKGTPGLISSKPSECNSAGELPRTSSANNVLRSRFNARNQSGSKSTGNVRDGSKGVVRNNKLKPKQLMVQPKRERQLTPRKTPSKNGTPRKSSAVKDTGGRQMVDKRTSRKTNEKHFVRAIAEYRENNSLGVSPDDDIEHIPIEARGRVRVFFRKRPLFASEKKADFDVITMDPRASASNEACAYIHNCSMHADLQRMHLKTSQYPCTSCFAEDATNEQVHETASAPLVRLAAAGKVATLFMFGQTGSGKTHTMSGLEELAAQQLFDAIRDQNQQEFAALKESEDRLVEATDSPLPPTRDQAMRGVVVSVSFFELAGKKCLDLLSTGKALEQITLREDGNGKVCMCGAKRITANGPLELLDIISQAKGRRSTQATGKNKASSRSHAVCQIHIEHNNAGGNDSNQEARSKGSKKTKKGHGLLTLVDCAGSERKEDSGGHDIERQRETAEINSSLHALKECVRAIAHNERIGNSDRAAARVPFRESNLTKVLMESFVRPRAVLAVIATVAPVSADTEHSMSTLKTACQLAGTEAQIVEDKINVELAHEFAIPASQMIPPAKWTASDMVDWISITQEGMFAAYAANLPSSADGKQVTRWTVNRFVQICDANERRGKKLHRLFREEMQRVSDLLAAKRQSTRD
jgi:kinesin family protein 2/24